MDNNGSLVQKIITELKKKVNTERKEMSKYYYPTSMEVLGVTVPDIRIIIKKINPDFKILKLDEKIIICQTLVDSDIFECQQLAYELIGKNKKLLQEISGEDILKLDKNQDNWVSVDTYSALILGVGWRMGKISDDNIISRARSENFWVGRQALVATLGWNQKARGGTGNTEKTIMICELLIDDHHDMINKALSWALRELSKTDKQAVTEFLNKYENRLAGRVRREVWNKIETGLKNR